MSDALARRLGAYLFGPGTADVALICAGTSAELTMARLDRHVDEVVTVRQATQRFVRARVGKRHVVAILDVHGAPVVADALTMLAEAGCRQAYFLGFAHAMHPAAIGELVVPTLVHPLDGFTNWFRPGTSPMPVPSSGDELADFLRLRGVEVSRRPVASVPCVFHDHPVVLDHLARGDVDLLEMELASAIWFGQRHGVDLAPMLVVSDTADVDLASGLTHREDAYANALGHLLDLIRSRANR